MKSPGLLAGGLMVAGGLFFLAWPRERNEADTSSPDMKAKADAPSAVQPLPKEAISANPSGTTTGSSPLLVPHDESSEAVLVKIQEIVATHDAKLLPALAGYLRHSDFEIRDAAREGVVQLGDAAGARYLREAADRAKTPAEALALLDAADFLELPPAERVTPEFIARQAAERARIHKKAPAP